MDGSKRREEILDRIQRSSAPVPAKDLAALFQVSRQVIVQDIALIRAAGYGVIATNRGYILSGPASAGRVFKVQHTDEQLEDELCAIVDLGGNGGERHGQSQSVWPPGGGAAHQFQKAGGGIPDGYQERKVKSAEKHYLRLSLSQSDGGQRKDPGPDRGGTEKERVSRRAQGGGGRSVW